MWRTILDQKNLPVIVVVEEDTLLLDAKSGQILSVTPVATKVISRGPAEVKIRGDDARHPRRRMSGGSRKRDWKP